MKEKLSKHWLQLPIFIAGAAFLLVLSLFVIWITKPPVECGRAIEDLPRQLEIPVNQACRQWLRSGIVEREQLQSWLDSRTIRYYGDPIPGESGRVQVTATHVIFSVPVCVQWSEDRCISFISGWRDVVFHEVGHLAMLAAGIPGRDHHQIMDEMEMCPGRCPSTID